MEYPIRGTGFANRGRHLNEGNGVVSENLQKASGFFKFLGMWMLGGGRYPMVALNVKASADECPRRTCHAPYS